MESNFSREDLAQLSDVAYQESNATKRHFARNIHKNLKYDSALSNKYVSVVRNSGNNDVFINFRGTKLDDFNDLSADLAILTGRENVHKRWSDANNHFEKVRDKLGDKNYIITGHSLGGNIGSSIARKNDLEAHIFNAGSSIGNVRKGLKQKPVENKRKNKITHYTTGDIISIGSVLNTGFADKHIFVEKKGSNAHSLENFI